jgi:hypothetical protein
MSERTIQVAKHKLIERLQQNRGKHEREYQEALEGYKARLVFVLTRKLEAAKKREDVDHRIDLVVPESHLADYDRALTMLEWEETDALALTQTEFDQFVLDSWPWRDEFLRVHASYIRPAGDLAGS